MHKKKVKRVSKKSKEGDGGGGDVQKAAPPARRKSVAASHPHRADTPSGERVSSPQLKPRKNRSQSSVNPPGFLSPLAEAPSLPVSSQSMDNIDNNNTEGNLERNLSKSMKGKGKPLDGITTGNTDTADNDTDNNTCGNLSKSKGKLSAENTDPIEKSTDCSDSSDESANKGLIMRTGGPKKCLPPISDSGRPRSRSMDHDNLKSESEVLEQGVLDGRQRASSLALNPLLDCELTPRGKHIASSWGNALFPVSILKNSTEKLNYSPGQSRKIVKVTFKDPSALTTVVRRQDDADMTSLMSDATATIIKTQAESTDSGNEEDFVTTDDEIGALTKPIKQKQQKDENQGFCTVVHSFTPRPKLHNTVLAPQAMIRPPSPTFGLYDSDDLDDDDLNDEEDEEVSTDEEGQKRQDRMHKFVNRSLATGQMRNKARNSASSSSSSNSSNNQLRRKPFK